MAILERTRCLALLLAAGRMGGAQAIDEYRVKAAFLYNFAKFVEWPPDAFKSPADPITICVLGNPFGDRLTATINGKQIDERRLVVRELPDAAKASGCQILFVAGEKKRGDLLGQVKMSPVLTVGETGGFAAAGGVVAFKLEDGRVRLQINVFAADRARLRISSKLLSLAEIITEGKK